MRYCAVDWLQLEKRFLAWGTDIGPNDTPKEAGLGLLNDWNKGDFGTGSRNTLIRVWVPPHAAAGHLWPAPTPFPEWVKPRYGQQPFDPADAGRQKAVRRLQPDHPQATGSAGR